ncbi:MAG: stage IV sporulation protein A [Oscillospiraceae bacterium]|nr:stage IV sporulation protein A [Oscillospiraceae bacterium]
MNSIYEEIGRRTDGNIYLAVVGPVRTGKSTFAKRFMEQLVIPSIDNVYHRERARDELPQSGSGKTITTSEPKFIPEQAVEISPDGTAKLRVRLIDSVGYMVPGAVGATEDGQPRMVTTPWYDHEIPMTQAAELGTKKVMEDHCTIGVVVTTDGSITDIPREDYLEPEARSIGDMKQTGKPFLVLLNSTHPDSPETKTLAEQLETQYGVHVMPVSCLTMEQEDILEILSQLLYEFPVEELDFYLPGWVTALPEGHPLKTGLYQSLKELSQGATHLRDTRQLFSAVPEQSGLEKMEVRSIEPGNGIVAISLIFPEALFYQVLSEETGMDIGDDGQLMSRLRELGEIKREYDRISGALEQVRATGYGIVMPTTDEMHLEVPEILRKNGSYGVKLKASAPSIHMLRADITTVLTPMVGDEKQSEDLVNYLLSEYEGNTEKLWESNIFGKSLFELVSEGLSSKLSRMPEDARMKLRQTISRIINEGSGGLICIIL